MTSASVSTPSKEVLLLQKEIFTIYLEPLLKIHNLSTTATSPNANVITYEDLTSSFQLAVASLGKTNTNVDVNGKSFVVRIFTYTNMSVVVYSNHLSFSSLSLSHSRTFYIYFSQRQKLIALHQSQIQAYHIAAKKALMEWANNVILPEINSSIHDTVTSYIKSCRAVTIATRPIWRDASVSLSSSSSTKKELPVNEMTMNIIDERAKAHYEKQYQQQQQTHTSQHKVTPTAMENIPEEGEEDEDGEINEDDNAEGISTVEATEEDGKQEIKNDVTSNDDGTGNEDGTKTLPTSATSSSTEAKVNIATTAKPAVPAKKNIVSLTNKSSSTKSNQTQMSPPPSKRPVATTKTKVVPIKKTNVTKPTTAAAQQHRNSSMNRGSGGGGGGRGNNNNNGITNHNNSNTNNNLRGSGGGGGGRGSGGGGGGRGSGGGRGGGSGSGK
jgi:hypothetical protein